MIKIHHSERMEFGVFLELFKLVPSLEERLMSSSEEDVIAIAEMVCLHVLRSAQSSDCFHRSRKAPMAPGPTIRKG